MFTAVSAKTEQRCCRLPSTRVSMPSQLVASASHKGVTGPVCQSAASFTLLGTLTLLISS